MRILRRLRRRHRRPALRRRAAVRLVAVLLRRATRLNLLADPAPRGLGLYVLDGHKPVRAANAVRWAVSLERHREIRFTEVGGGFVSTIFMGIDHNFFGIGAPILFETMAFLADGSAACQQRYASWDAALAGHGQVVAAQRRARAFVDGLAAPEECR